MKKRLPLISKIDQFIFTALMLALFGVNSANATTYYARANGNWNVNTTWSLSSGGPAVTFGIWPVAGDIVYIGESSTARTVTIPATFAANCASINMGAANGTAATLTLAAATSSLNVSGSVIIYGPLGNSSRILNANAGTVTIGGNLELGNGQVNANGNRVCRVVITTGSVSVTGNLVFNNVLTSSNNQTHLEMSGGAGSFNLSGAFTIVNAHGTLTAGTASTFNFNGSAAGQTIPTGVAAVVYNHIHINNTHSGGATLSAAITGTNVTGNVSVQTGILNNGGFAITLATNRNFSVASGAVLNLTGTSTMVTVSGTGTKTFGPSSTVNYAGTNQAVTAESYGNLSFNDGGTKTMATGTTYIYSNWTNNSTVDATTNGGAVIFCGSGGAQTIGGSSLTTFFDLNLNNAAGAMLGINTTIANTLTLTSGSISTGANTLIISNNATTAISGASSTRYIIGNLQLAIAEGANSYNFPIGTTLAYAPVSMAFNAGTQAGSLKGFTTDGDHPDIISSSFTSSSTVNRYWTFTIASGLATANYDAVFNWVSSDQDATFNYPTAYVEKYSGGTWTFPVMGTLSSTSAQITGETGFSDFQVGNGCFFPPTATISGNFETCAGTEISIRVDLTGTPDWSYTWSDGTNSGTVNDITESPSFFSVYPDGNKTYTITSVTDVVGCTGTAYGSAVVVTGPATKAPDIIGCAGELIEVPVKVSSFKDIGAISLTLVYDKSVMTYDSYSDVYGLIDFVHANETGTSGIVRISGISEIGDNLDDDAVLITLKFNYKGGHTDLTWDDSGDGTKCEYAHGSPDFETYCDIPYTAYYTNGSVSDSPLTPVFSVDNLFPPLLTTVQLTNTTSCITRLEWSFDRPADVVYVSGDYESPEPQVQFTDGGAHIVTLTVFNPTYTASTSMTIQTGVPGLWDGPVSEDWFTNTNWDNHIVPTTITDVLISTRPMIPAVHYYPHLTGDLTIGGTVNSITLTGTAELYISGALTVNAGKALIIRDNSKVFANGR